MKRRDFFKKTSAGVAAAALLPIVGSGCARTEEKELRSDDKWYQLGTGKVAKPNRQKTLDYDVAVIGGGMAGISAAISAARNGAKTVLVQDRPVLGGNASSEMRVTVNGVQNLRNEHQVERETGIVEEILIENWHYNPQESYPVWDHVLYAYVSRQDNLDLMLNTQAIEAKVNDNVITSAVCWQSTSETRITINAKQFVDCSGDGLLAAAAGAEYRTGREGKSEFNESYAPEKSDGWVMGDCIMMNTKDMGHPVPFFAPDYAIPFNAEKAFQDKHRRIKQLKEGFWWIELGSDYDIIAEREENRHGLMAYFYGVWDYIKNSGKYPEADNLALDWIGSIPGRRESRRFMGDHILNEKDLTQYRHFDDAVAYGGWSLDEHCPGGIKNLDEPASFFHQRFTKMYEIPYRSLYSKNIKNLSFAGRNVSVTHIALSSTRIIGTCSMMGQAVGAGAAMCVKKGINPRQLANKNINELQETLLRDDMFIPNRPAQDPADLVRKASSIYASSTISDNPKLLFDGVSRDELEKIHHWQAKGTDATLTLEWESEETISKVEVKCDTNLQKKMMMHKNPKKNKGQHTSVPQELVRTMKVEALVNGQWQKVTSVDNNLTRLVKMSFESLKTKSIRLHLEDTWGAPNVKLFEVRCYS